MSIGIISKNVSIGICIPRYILVNLVSKMFISVDSNNLIELFVNLTVNLEMYRYKHRFFIINKHVTDIWLGQRSTYPQLISDLLDWETSYSLL